jgi:hypothetical protein
MKLDTQVEPNSDTDEFRNEWSSESDTVMTPLHPTGSTVLNRSKGIASKGIKVDGASKTLSAFHEACFVTAVFWKNDRQFLKNFGR